MNKSFTPKEKQQLAVIGALVAVAVIYGLWALAFVPMRKDANEQAAKCAEMVKTNALAQQAVAEIPAHEARIQTLNATLRHIAETYALRPALGASYQLGMRPRFDPLAAASGFEVQSMTVQDPVPLPWNRPGAPLSRCSADIVGSASYQQIRDFLAAIEADNPYVYVTGLTLSANPGDVRRHRVTIRIECISAPTEITPL
ncbi:MAG: hypothetical protein FJ222_02750 [Lentisphaerae bacterium]|nr:hypothetical protein [Lentisphaerota bacterium]